MNPILTKSYRASAAIAGYLVVAGIAGNQVRTATGPTDTLIGAAGAMGADANGLLDLVEVGLSEVRLGGNVTFGDPLTSDANGKAVKAVATAGQVIRVIGYARADGADGDIAPFQVAPSILAPLT